MDILSRVSLTGAMIPFNLILCTSLLARGRSKTVTERMFAMLVYVITLGGIIDIINTVLLVQGPVPSPLVSRALSSFTLGLSVASSYYMLRYVDASADSPTLEGWTERAFRFSFMVCIAVLVLNIPIGWVFTTDAFGAAVRGPLYIPAVYWQRIAYALLAIVLVIIFRKKYEKTRFVMLIIAGVTLISMIMAERLFFAEYTLMFAIAAIGCNSILLLIETPVYERVAETQERLSRTLQRVSEEEKEAIRQNRSKTQFLSEMSHQIRTPLTAILGMNEMILRESKEEATLKEAEDIKSAGNTLLYIINDILDFSKIETGTMDILPRNYYLGRMLRDVENMIRIKTEEKGLRLITHIDKTLPDRLSGDEVRVKQILINLLNNSVKYTVKGSVTLRVNGRIVGDDLVLSCAVEDTGIGIKEEDLPTLFESFGRLEEERNAAVEGTGLGLPITARLVQRMGGTIDVRSVYGEGSTFTVTIPQRIVDTEGIEAFETRKGASSSAYRVSFRAADARILAVDDDEMSLAVMSAVLKETGVVIDTVRSGEEALARVKERAYDLLLMDSRMPGMDGEETLKRLRSGEGNLSEKAPVIVVTASALSGERERLIAAGFDAFVSKPLQGTQLEDAVRELLPPEKVKLTEDM